MTNCDHIHDKYMTLAPLMDAELYYCGSQSCEEEDWLVLGE